MKQHPYLDFVTLKEHICLEEVQRFINYVSIIICVCQEQK